MPYSENRKAWFREWHAKRQEQGLCIYCGKPREGEGGTKQACPACAARKRLYLERLRRKKRAGTNYDDLLKREGAPLPLGPAAGKIGVVKVLHVKLDLTSLQAVRDIYEQYKKKQKAQGKPVEPFQMSRILREAIQKWEKRFVPPRPREGVMVGQIAISLDARTLAIIQRQADYNCGGVQARAVRALLAGARPKVIGATSGVPRLSAL